MVVEDPSVLFQLGEISRSQQVHVPLKIDNLGISTWGDVLLLVVEVVRVVVAQLLGVGPVGLIDSSS